MPSRIIREEILTSERIDQLDFAAEVFYRRLLSKVDDYGLFDARPAVLRATLYPLRIDRVREADCTRWIAMCEKAGLIALYQHDGKPYVAVLRTGWQVRSAPKYPRPPEGVNDCAHVQTGARLDVVVDVVADVEKPKGRQADRFSDFWTAYPKKVKRKPAETKWKAKRLDARADEIIADVQNRLRVDKRWLDGFIPDPTTYLAQERWNDELPVPAPSAVPSGKPKGPSESPLERAVAYARQQFHYGAIDEAERDRLIAAATAKHRGQS